MGARRFDLLLANAATGRPALSGGVSDRALRDPPQPRRAPRRDDSPFRRDSRERPDDLPKQRWGIVAPAGEQGDRLLEAIAPLRRLREAQQGADALVFRADPGLDARASVDWKDRYYRALPEREQPLYLVLLGDLHQLSIELQHTLANSALVGRLAFTQGDGSPDLPAYAAYAAKAETFARSAAAGAPDLCLFVAKDGTDATAIGDEHLVRPCRAEAIRHQAGGHLAAGAVRELTTVEDLFLASAEPRPQVLLSVSHGLGVPGPPPSRYAHQGALQLSETDLLDAERVRTGRFLPGGLWFCLACFGAGTPAASLYYPWLSQLSSADPDVGGVDYVLQCLAAGPDERPFIARMPQAALANPEGPLGIIGHVDLAWSYSFTTDDFSKSNAGRIFSLLKILVNGGRAGVALDALMNHYREANDALVAIYQSKADAEAMRRPDRTDPLALANQWMLRNDLRGYILLGDPAARLPTFAPDAASASPAPARPVAAPSVSTAEADPGEAAIAALLEGNEAPRAIAARHGMTLEALWERLRARWTGQGGAKG
jgi:hypothetical protein